MQTYIVHVHRAHPGTIGPVSGVPEDNETAHTEDFHGFNELQHCQEIQ